MELLISLRTDSYGEIVHYQDDGSTWGNLECLDSFLVVQVDDVSVSEITATDGLNGKIKKFDVDAAFTDEAIENLRALDWFVPVRSAEYIVDK